jgi:hypothetical protein
LDDKTHKISKLQQKEDVIEGGGACLKKGACPYKDLLQKTRTLYERERIGAI